MVEPGDASALSQTIERLCDPQLRQQLADQGRQRLEEGFTISRSASDCLALYRKLLA